VIYFCSGTRVAAGRKNYPTPPSVIKSPYLSEAYQHRPLITVMTQRSHLSLEDHPHKVQKLVNIHFMLTYSSDCSTCLFSWNKLAAKYGRWCRWWLQ